MTATLSPATTPVSGGSPQTSWEQMNETGRRLYGEGNMTGAELAFVAAIEEGERPGSGVDPLRLASSISNLAQLKYQQKDTGHAEELFRRALELREGVLGAEHPTVVSSINNLAALYVARGALDEAEPLLQRAMTATTKRLEAAQADLSVNINNMVRLYYKRGEYTRAEPLLLQLLASKRPLGAEHPDIAAVLVSLAKLRQSMGRPDAAERVWRRVLAVRDRTLPPTDPGVLAVLDGLAEACAAQGKAEQEYVVRERALLAREQVLGGDHPALAAARARMEELRSAVAAATATTTLPEMAPPETPSPRRSVEVIDVGPAAALAPMAPLHAAPLHERKARHSAGRQDRRGSRQGTMWIVAAACVAVAIAGVLIFGRDLLSAARPQASTAVVGAQTAGSSRVATPHVTIGASTSPTPAVGPVVAPATQPVQVRAVTAPRAPASRASHPRVTGAPNTVADSFAIGDARAPPPPPSPAVDLDAATRGLEPSAPSKP